MIKNRKAMCLIVFMLCVSVAGCAGVQRKFARKKKEEPKPLPIVATYDYAKELRVDELYKKHFLFWKTWQGELIDRMGGGYKKRVECYDQIIANLIEMKKYLNDPKGLELEPFINEILSIDPSIRKIDLTRNETYRMRRLLEQTRRQIEKRFSYSDVKNSLELKNKNVN
ncbi:MAG: hypothetical protein WC569_03995 [Candidatus Omnitrophota bacterium]